MVQVYGQVASIETYSGVNCDREDDDTVSYVTLDTEGGGIWKERGVRERRRDGVREEVRGSERKEERGSERKVRVSERKEERE